MKRVFSSVILLASLSLAATAQTAPDGAELTKLLKDFLDGASRNDSAMHDRFWADDLIYTGSAGRRIGKADIMRDQRPAQTPNPGRPGTVFSAEDIRIQQYGSTAIVAFRLVGSTKTEDRTEVSNYLNSGTFLKRNGKWQVVSWQSTRMPRSDEVSRSDVAAAEAAFNRAVLAADVKRLESIVDESFVWTHDSGQRVSRPQLLEQLGSGQLKYTKLETSGVTIALTGDTAIVRGATTRQRAAIPGESSNDSSQFTAFYTLTLVNRGSGWKIVALHTSRP